LSQNARDFFGTENDKAMDLGFTLDIIDDVVQRLEPEIFVARSASTKATTMALTPLVVGQKMMAMGATIPADLSKRISYHLKKLGYAYRSYMDNGKVVRAMVIDLNNENLIKRVRKHLKQPEF
jgi:hypothetical protein